MGWKVHLWTSCVLFWILFNIALVTTLDFNKHVSKSPVDYKCIDIVVPLVHKRV